MPVQPIYPNLQQPPPYSANFTASASIGSFKKSQNFSISVQPTPPVSYAPAQYVPQSVPPQGVYAQPVIGTPVVGTPVMGTQVMKSGSLNSDEESPTEYPNVDDRSELAKSRFSYSDSHWRDKFFLFLFIGHLIAMIVIADVYGKRMLQDVQDGTTGSQPGIASTDDVDEKMLIALLAVSVLVGGVFGGMWLAVLKQYGGQLIKFSIIVECVMMFLATLVAILTGNILMFVCYVIITVVSVLYFYWVRRRIPFAEAMLFSARQAVKDYPGVVGVSYLTAFLNTAWFVCWSFIFVAVYHNTNGRVDTPLDRFIMFALFVSLYWTSQVLKNVSHVTTAGVVGTWWLVPSVDEQGGLVTLSPTCPALKRSCTTSLGSICFGSLIVAVLRALRAMLRSVRAQEENILTCLVDCVLSLVESAIRYFNQYAFTYVAIYGYDFRQAASHTWDLFKSSGIDALINDDLTGLALTLSCIIGGVVTAFVGGLWAYSTQINNWQALTVLTFMIGFVMTNLTMGTLESGVATTFVLWAEDPESMAANKPAHFNRIRTAAAQIYPAFANQSDSSNPDI